MIPVSADGSYHVVADHGNGLTTDGLTTDPNAICSGSLAIPAYTGNTISSSGDAVMIYSCSASNFMAYTDVEEAAIIEYYYGS
jgi:hypothetical protein